jgi:hypothetical protein
MAFQKVESFLTQKPGMKPWFSDWVDAMGTECYGSIHEITEVRETGSRAGIMLESDKFNIMIYKSNDLCDTALEEVDRLYNSPTGGALLIQIDPGEELGFALGVDIETQRVWSKRKKYPGGFRYQHDYAAKKKRTRTRNLPAAPLET